MSVTDYIGRFWTGAEVMYGIIITMTFTSMLRDIPVVPDIVVDRLIIAALSCCIAWGIADGFFYLWERGYIIRRENTIIDLSRSSEVKQSAVSMVGEELDDTILRTIPLEKRQYLYEKLVLFLSSSGQRRSIAIPEAVIIVLGTFLRSAGASLIMVAPFFIIDDVWEALLISNVTGILLLFIVGYIRSLDRTFSSRVLFGLGSGLIGIIIAAITVVLGG